MVSNPRCLISQIAVTFDEGNRAGVRRETDPVREGMCVFVCAVLFAFSLFFSFSFFADVYSTDPAVPSASEQILL